MESHDLKTLLTVDNRLIAEDIQAILEEHEIYTILFSDNSAASIISTYSGLNPIEAIEIVLESQYNELVQ